MRLLIVGSDKVHAIENFFVQHARVEGVAVSLFPATSYFYDYYYQGIVHKLLYRAGLSRVLHRINHQFKKAVETFKPDVIWVFKGMEIFAATLAWAHSRGIKLANYNTDNPFIFTGRGSGNKHITASLPLYDLHFTYNLEIQAALQRRFSVPVILLPFAFDIPEQVYNEAKEEQEIPKACFMGNPDAKRAALLESLAEKGAAIDVYGNHWQQFVTAKNITVYPPVYETELWKVLRRYRVQLNIMRVHNEHSHNMRSFEVPAIGGIMLAPDTPEHRLFFENGKEIFLYKDAADCVEKIHWLLQRTAAEAMAIRQEARKRCVESGYSYAARTRQAICEMKKLYA